jgi:transcriptional regulator with XRE-family HTH domain
LASVQSQASDWVMFSPSQLRAARALVNWTRADLADRSGVSLPTIQAFETEVSDPRQSTLIALRLALANAGVIFLDESDVSPGPGIAIRDKVAANRKDRSTKSTAPKKS